ncbi:hypothetical protein [Streptomyces sp. NK15101]|uniref:hypothetical protein n=1 Tax=Streptomyces sp. NK15101 TaxID=2873261 RepID=UPI001CEE070F|nr:hypothetical protein [Streptomyces sp. NK15101]
MRVWAAHPRRCILAASISADDRARALRWLQENAEDFLGFDFLFTAIAKVRPGIDMVRLLPDA